MPNAIFHVSAQEFMQIPGSPIIYWLSPALLGTFNSRKKFTDYGDARRGESTGDNARFVRLWHEIACSNIALGKKSEKEYRASRKKWVPFIRGGSYRKWYGNQDAVLPYDKNSYAILRSMGNHLPSRDLYFKSCIVYSKVVGNEPSFRFFPAGFIFSDSGSAVFSEDKNQEVILSVANSSTFKCLLAAVSPTLNIETGQLNGLPFHDIDGKGLLNVSELIKWSREDWDSFETSWGFRRFALLDSEQGAQLGNSLEDAVIHLREYWDRVSEEQRQREIHNNELVADAYGVCDDVPCDVPLERVSLKRNVAFAYPKDSPGKRNEKFAQDVVKELISYAVGCMFGRYSLDKPGLILASQGETLDDYHAQIPNPSFEPDEDNVIPVAETDCFEDDIVTRFRRFLEVAFGKDNLAANIAYIEQVLGKSIRKYFVNDFYNDHVKMYSSRPIYWQYSSQTNNKGAFKALVYLHRYTPKTTSTVLNYLRDYINKITDIADGLEHSDRAADQKEAVKMRKAILECKDYEDQTLYPLATRNLEMDLDDGVLVNYLRMGKALRSIPSIERKRKEVSTWTWPIHPLES